jgi:D-alanine-D-alanine ligase
MRPVAEHTDEPAAFTWETAKGFEGGTLLVGHLDKPVHADVPAQMFRREPEWLYGDGIGSSRAPLASLELVLRALRSRRLLRRLPLGVLYYTDEGRDARYSTETIRAAAAKAKRVLILRPGNVGDRMITQRRGQRRYRFTAEGDPLRPGRAAKKPEVFRWISGKLETFAEFSSRKRRVSVSTLDLRTERLPMLLPHRVTATVLITYPDAKIADEFEEKMRSSVGGGGPRWELKLIADRPPMRERRGNLQLARAMERVAADWEIPLTHESSVWPSVAGLVPAKVACVCGVGPVARDLGTPHESVQRISLVQRTLLLAQFLLKELGK